MKKKLLLVMLMLGLSKIALSQELGKPLDYQYIRTEEVYNAYTAYVSNIPKSINLLIVSTYQLSGLKKIYIKRNNKFINIPFSIINIPIVNDNNSLTTKAVRLDIKKLTDDKDEQDTMIRFILKDENQFELPFFKSKFIQTN